MMRAERFGEARDKVMLQEKENKSIGNQMERRLHAVLKEYYEPDARFHEIRVGRYIADVCKEHRIVEIQTRQLGKLRAKLDAFLPDYEVTVVYPMAAIKWLSWIDVETGEISPKRKSPKKPSALEAFTELYQIKTYLTNPHLHIHILMLEIKEYRLKNGYASEGKKGSTRFERVPISLIEELAIEKPEDFLQFIPETLAEPFTVKEYAKAQNISERLSGVVLPILAGAGTLERTGKRGRSYEYVRLV